MGEAEDWSGYNFIWTQWKSNKILGYVKTWKEVQEQDKDTSNHDKKRSSQSTRGGGHIDS
jgi:hypothetical protein